MLSREALPWASANTQINTKSICGKYLPAPPPLPSKFNPNQQNGGGKQDISGRRRKARIVQTEPRLNQQTQPRIINSRHMIVKPDSRKTSAEYIEENHFLSRKKQDEKVLATNNSKLNLTQKKTQNESFHGISTSKNGMDKQPSLPLLPKNGASNEQSQSHSDLELKFRKAKDHWREAMRCALAKEHRMAKEIEEKDKLLANVDPAELSKLKKANSELKQKLFTNAEVLDEKNKSIDLLQNKVLQGQQHIKDMFKHVDSIELQNEQLTKDKQDLTVFVKENLSTFIKDKKLMLREVDRINDEFDVEKSKLLKEIDGYKSTVNGLEEEKSSLLKQNIDYKKKVTDLEEKVCELQKEKDVFKNKVHSTKGDSELLKETNVFKNKVIALEKIVKRDKKDRYKIRYQREKCKIVLRENIATIDSLESEIQGLKESREALKKKLKQQMEANTARFANSMNRQTNKNKNGISNVELVVVNHENQKADTVDRTPYDEKKTSGGRRCWSAKRSSGRSGSKPGKRC